MKKLSIIIVFLTNITAYALSQSEANTVIKNFKPEVVSNTSTFNYFHRLLPTTTINKIYSTPYPETYAIIVGNNILYGNLHSHYLIIGHMVNIYTQDDISTNLQQTTLPKIDISKLDIQDAVISKASHKVNKKLIIFVDPDCPYCHKLEQDIVTYKLNNKADIYYLLMPLAIHPQAKAHVKNILCASNQLATLQAYMSGKDPKVSIKADCNIDAALERTGSIARSLNINAVPTIITGSGKMIMGSDINSIQEYLK